jgi:spoIIIJ-associated protein
MKKVIMQMAPQLLKINQSKPDREFNQSEIKNVRKRTVKDNHPKLVQKLSNHHKYHFGGIMSEVKSEKVVEKKSLIAQLEEEGDVAADYLEGLLDIADLDGDIDIDVENDRAALAIAGGKLSHLVGGRGEVLDSLQELTRLAVQTSLGERSRLMLDIDNFRSDKKAELAQLAKETAEEVKSTGEAIKLRPMNAFERKVVHDTIQEIGLTSESEGEDPDRCVVVLPA